MVLKKDIQGTWTSTFVDIPKVAVRRMPVEDASQSQVSLTDDSDTNCVSPPPRQVTTKKTTAVTQRKRGPVSGWMKYVHLFSCFLMFRQVID